jgi:nucleoid DNA-binding protein
MKPRILAKVLAERTRISSAAARDQVDEVVTGILMSLRKGRKVDLPGVGKLTVKPAGRRRNA